MSVMGIDSGKTGGLAVIGDDGVWIEPMPCNESGLDTKELGRLLHAWEGDVRAVYIESIFAIPKSGAHSMMVFGRNYGIVIGMLSLLGFRIIEVRPQEWQREMYKGCPPALQKKDRSVWAADQSYPIDNFKMVGCRKPHMGMVEAFLIAKYGRERG